MSLINEALKKAERLRNEAAAESAPTALGGGPRARRGSTQNSGTMVLIGSGALVLVVLSVVFTVYLVNRPSKPVTTARVTAATPESTSFTQSSAATTPEPSTPPIVLPSITPPAASTPPASQHAGAATANNAAPLVASTSAPPTTPSAVNGTSAATSPSLAPHDPGARPAPLAQSSPATPVPAVTAATDQAVVSAPPTPAPALAPDAPDERVTAFVDAVRVTGIRSSGAESRVLMNERVYRVNDIVERTLNVRLVSAAADSLTFSDARGVTYVKRF